MQNSNNSNYYKLKADEYAILMRECFEESQNTWKRGDKAKAKEFSTKGNDYKNLLAEANKQFCEIFKFEKEQKRNVNFKEHIIDEIVKEKNLKDSKKLNNHDLLITDFDNFENNITVEKIEQTACEVNDFNNKDIDSEYNFYRKEAEKCAEKMSETFSKSKIAWEKGDKAKAKELSNLGHEYKEKMELNNSLAIKIIATKNNHEREENEIDLHGLYVNEAIEYFKKTLVLKMENKNNINKFESLRVIVGKGLHSKDKPKIKSAIINFASLNNLVVFEEPNNEGCLIVCKPDIME